MLSLLAYPPLHGDLEDLAARRGDLIQSIRVSRWLQAPGSVPQASAHSLAGTRPVKPYLEAPWLTCVRRGGPSRPFSVAL